MLRLTPDDLNELNDMFKIIRTAWNRVHSRMLDKGILNDKEACNKFNKELVDVQAAIFHFNRTDEEKDAWTME